MRLYNHILPKLLKNNYVILTLLFVLSRVAFYKFLPFDTSSLVRAWQLLDPLWLYNLPLKDIFIYLHMQPPLFNTFTAISLKVFGDPTPFWEITFFILGFLCVLIAYETGKLLKIRRRILLPILVFLLVFNINFIVYERWYFYTYPTMFLFLLYIFLFLKGRYFLAFMVLALLIFTRATFQIILFPIIWLFAFFFMRSGFKSVFLSSLLPFAISLTLYLKNLFLFGGFFTSSWGGMNLYRGILITGKIIPIERDCNFLKPFSKVKDYKEYFYYEKTGITILDEETEPYTKRNNYNHIIYTKVNDKYLKLSFSCLTKEPYRLLIMFGVSLVRFLKPPFEYLREFSKRFKFFSVPYMILTLLFVLSIFLLFADWKNPKIAFTLLNLIYYILITSLDPGENNRFRMVVEPIFILSFAYAINRITSSKWKSSRAQKGLNM